MVRSSPRWQMMQLYQSDLSSWWPTKRVNRKDPQSTTSNLNMTRVANTVRETIMLKTGPTMPRLPSSNVSWLLSMPHLHIPYGECWGQHSAGCRRGGLLPVESGTTSALRLSAKTPFFDLDRVTHMEVKLAVCYLFHIRMDPWSTLGFAGYLGESTGIHLHLDCSIIYLESYLQGKSSSKGGRLIRWRIRVYNELP